MSTLTPEEFAKLLASFGKLESAQPAANAAYRVIYKQNAELAAKLVAAEEREMALAKAEHDQWLRAEANVTANTRLAHERSVAELALEAMRAAVKELLSHMLGSMRNGQELEYLVRRDDVLALEGQLRALAAANPNEAAGRLIATCQRHVERQRKALEHDNPLSYPEYSDFAGELAAALSALLGTEAGK